MLSSASFPKPSQRHLLLLRLSSRLKLDQQRPSGPRIFSSAAATTTTTAAPSTAAPRIISRRAWNEYKRKHPSLYNSGPPNAAAAASKNSKANDSSSWPKSVLYTGYALAGTLIPYISVWVALSNDTIRPVFLQYLKSFPAMEAALRRHFGTPEWDAVPYPDQISSRRTAKEQQQQPPSTEVRIPHQLMGELTEKERRTQERIEADAQGQVTVSMQLYDGTSQDVVQEETKSLDCSALATSELLETTAGSQQSLAIAFPLESSAESVNEEEAEDSSLISSSSPPDPLLGQVNTYSLWHYQPVVPAAAQGSKGDPFYVSDRDLERAQLQSDIASLEQELRTGTSARSVDEIVAELDARKQRLRRLEWNKWLPW